MDSSSPLTHCPDKAGVVVVLSTGVTAGVTQTDRLLLSSYPDVVRPQVEPFKDTLGGAPLAV